MLWKTASYRVTSKISRYLVQNEPHIPLGLCLCSTLISIGSPGPPCATIICCLISWVPSFRETLYLLKTHTHTKKKKHPPWRPNECLLRKHPPQNQPSAFLESTFKSTGEPSQQGASSTLRAAQARRRSKSSKTWLPN